VSDREEITALVHRYADLLDGGDMDGVVELFADATWRSAATGQVLRGHEQIRRVYDRIILYEGIPRTRHLMTNLVIDVEEGAHEATGHCSYTVLQCVERTTRIEAVVMGRYYDRYARGSNGWRFTDRLFVVDLSGDQSRHFV
jgi:3-phenylpropionate/cinnamic acid dioxygenase small subunit